MSAQGGLAGLITALGTKASRKIGDAKGGAMSANTAAITGHYQHQTALANLEATKHTNVTTALMHQMTHEHNLNVIKAIHGNAEPGTKINLKMGETAANYVKKNRVVKPVAPVEAPPAAPAAAAKAPRAPKAKTTAPKVK